MSPAAARSASDCTRRMLSSTQMTDALESRVRRSGAGAGPFCRAASAARDTNAPACTPSSGKVTTPIPPNAPAPPARRSANAVASERAATRARPGSNSSYCPGP